VVAEPAKRAHCADESNRRQNEGDPEAGGVRGQENRALDRRLCVPGQHEHRGEDGSDARRRTHGKRGTEQGARSAPVCARQEARRDDPFGPRQKSEEREPEHDEDEPGELGPPVQIEQTAERRRPGPKGDEDGGEAENERNARLGDAEPDARLAEPVCFDRRNRR
jgi:hypothetical protein